MCDYLLIVALPELLRQRQQELEDDNFDMIDLLHKNRLTKLMLGTVYYWLDHLSFKYEARKKGYYVDNHEKAETIVYCRHFIKCYLEYENRIFCWIQLPLEEVKEMEESLECDKGLGYWYSDSELGKSMFKFHVNEHPSFQDCVNNKGWGQLER
jgi:hypothetical protein